MVKLTEEMIVARTRVSDMANVKKLNCWGAELTDVTVLRKLINVEVLSLSVNCISTLADIQNCKNLQELYIRKNKIPDLSEICWLRDLTKLKSLWLEENPCVQDHGELYRVTVVRNLPQLQKLDNTAVQPDEMADAMRRGMELIHPLEREPVYQSMSPYQKQSVAQPGGRLTTRDSVPRGQEGSLESDEHISSHRDDQPGGLNRRLSQEQSCTPSRRVSNQAFDSSSAASTGDCRTSPGRQMSTYGSRRSSSVHAPAGYGGGPSGMDDPGYGNVVSDYHVGRRYSQQDMGNVRRSPRVSQASMDEGVRRMSVHEAAAYEDERNANSYGVMTAEARGAPLRNASANYGAGGAPSSDVGHASYGYPAGGYYEYNQRGSQAQPYFQNGHDTAAATNSESSTNCSVEIPPLTSVAALSSSSSSSHPHLGGVVRNSSPHLVHSASASEAASMSNTTHSSHLTRSVSTNSALNGENTQGQHLQQQLRRANTTSIPNGESDSAAARAAVVAQHYEQTYEQVNQQIDSAQQLIAMRKSYSPERPRRPKNRNSNILSAVLCLIKELDGPSLEVAEMAVRCRMEELDD